jgi:hypothetical protein
MEENDPLDLAYVASVHGIIANGTTPLAAKACPPKVRAANNDSEYEAVKKTDAGLKQKSAETRKDARSISGCFRSSSDRRSSEVVMSYIAIAATAKQNVLMNRAANAITPSNVDGSSSDGTNRSRNKARYRMHKGNSGKNACACSESPKDCSDVASFNFIADLEGILAAGSTASFKNLAPSHLVLGFKISL